MILKFLLAKYRDAITSYNKVSYELMHRLTFVHRRSIERRKRVFEVLVLTDYS